MAPRRSYLTLASLLLLPTCLMGCQGGDPADSAYAQTGGKSRGPNHTVHQIEPFFADETTVLTHAFRVENNTTTSVRFSKPVEISCACSEAGLQTNQLAPGEVTSLQLKAVLRDRTGPQRFSCRIQPDGGGPPWIYEVETTIYQRLVFAPVALHLGLIDPSTPVSSIVSLQMAAPSEDELPTLDSVASSSKDVSLSVEQGSVEINPSGIARKTLPIRLTLAPQASPGRGAASLEVRCGNHSGHQACQLSVTWNVRSLYCLTPPRAFFGRCQDSNGPITKCILLKRDDSQPFEIIKATTNNPAVECSFVENDTGQFEFAFTLQSDLITAPLYGEAIIETNHPIQPVVKVPFSALP